MNDIYKTQSGYNFQEEISTGHQIVNPSGDFNRPADSNPSGNFKSVR